MTMAGTTIGGFQGEAMYQEEMRLGTAVNGQIT